MPSATQMSGLRRRNTGYRHSRIDDVFAKRRNGTNSRRWSPQEFHGGHLRAAQQVRCKKALLLATEIKHCTAAATIIIIVQAATVMVNAAF
ncbi:unnamed protein product [Lampetra planeri]